MNMSERKIAFKVEFSQMLELLADRIYQSPLALLRENTQNAFDAICMRKALSHRFEPMIQVTVDGEQVVVSDNGIGMTRQEIETNYWHAGKSGKNTEAARAAGVVGTFGIGAMANFGVATELSVESESATTRERTRSSVRRSELSTDTESISVISIPPSGEPGTTVCAQLATESKIPVQDARSYLHEFVEFLDVPVFLNGDNLSGVSHRAVLPSQKHAWSERCEDMSLADILCGDLELLGMASGELRVVFENVRSATGIGRLGSIVLQQGRNAIRTQRSGFGLATIAMQSGYQWGGVIDLPFLQPTAGREALDTSSNQLLQKIISVLDDVVSPMAARHVESFGNDGFLQWVLATRQFALCGPLEATLRPTGKTEQLVLATERGGLRYYTGRDESVIQQYASEDEPLVVLSRRNPRRNCELGYLRMQNVVEVDTSPKVIRTILMTDLSFGYSALATRVVRILEEDYFLGVDVQFGEISSNLPVLVDETQSPVVLYLDPNATSVAPLPNLYENDFEAFTSFVKDFIRSVIFPRIEKLVPSSTRAGAEAFLRHLRTNREWFEYDFEDKADLDDVLEDLRAGRLSVVEAGKRLANKDLSVVEVSRMGTAPFSSVVSDVGRENPEQDLSDPYAPRPGIDRREQQTSARILTCDAPVNGYTCFLSLSDRVLREKGDFFRQPHATEIVWGGRKVIFVFQHHSGRFGLYYDILCPGLVGETSGGGPRITSTVLAANRTFIPVPTEIADTFLPGEGERKRLEVRCDILYLKQ